jgi:hypothetical protein
VAKRGGGAVPLARRRGRGGRRGRMRRKGRRQGGGKTNEKKVHVPGILIKENIFLLFVFPTFFLSPPFSLL